MPKPKTYISPKLTRHGALSRITQGSSGGNQDGKGGVKGGGGGGGPGGGKGGGKGSDRRLKKRIVPVACLRGTIGLYLFDYIEPANFQEAGRQLGVMADELFELMPDAVYESDSGFLHVDYDRLDIRPQEVADAFARKSLNSVTGGA